jgi:outer membrane protein assembly factor BamB
MTETIKTEIIGSSGHEKPIRLWPGITLVMVLIIIRYVLPNISPDFTVIGVFGGLFGSLLIVVWWAFFSHAKAFDRIAAIGLMILTLAATSQIIDISIKTSMMGLMFAIYAIPFLMIAFVAWAALCRNLPVKSRRLTMVVTIILATGFWVCIRTNGMTGDAHHDLVWRWAKTSEERLLAQSTDKITPVKLDSATMATEPEWSGFRGNNRDGIVQGSHISTNWKEKPPVEIWRKPIGPACSSFAVHGNLLYTQEQRGEFEMVSCYNLKTGALIWQHGDSTRFWDSHAGAGPRSTPTLSNDKIYTLGGTGILNVLDAYSGKVIWSHNAAADTKVVIPGWGYTSSPLVVDSIVIVGISSQILAYNFEKRKLLWTAQNTGESYSSPHLCVIDNVKQVLFQNKAGIASYLPENGKELWKFTLEGVRIIQPSLISNNDLIIDLGDLQGLKRISVKNNAGNWTVKESWTSTSLKPNHNDILINKGYAYGIDMPGTECISLENGERKWKGKRYGGQMLLLADQDLLLILSEKGEFVLVGAKPEKFSEIARFKAIEGKTWNHPVLVGDILVVRNSNEMAAFKLPH